MDRGGDPANPGLVDHGLDVVHYSGIARYRRQRRMSRIDVRTQTLERLPTGSYAPPPVMVLNTCTLVQPFAGATSAASSTASSQPCHR